MTERERLIELLNKEINKKTQFTLDSIADYLLINGVLCPPCKEGDTVYVIKRCHCNNPKNYDLRRCHKNITAKTPEPLARVMVQEMRRRLKPKSWSIEYEIVPVGTICYSIYKKEFRLNMLTEIDKTVFTTLDEAKEALRLYATDNKGGSEE